MSLTRILKRMRDRLRPHSTMPVDEAERVFRQAAGELGAEDIAIDCGANIGRYTEVVARSGARVYAFEPNPDAFAVLSRRMRRYPNVVCLNKAVAAKAGTVPLYLHEHAASDPLYWSTGASMLPNKGNVNKDTFVEVEALSFVDFLLSLSSPVALVKMDIEGAEVALLDRLLGQPRALAAIGWLFIETHDHKIPELRDGTKRLREQIRQRGLDRINLNWR
jgi:FkbM family methyltransferase